MNLTKFEGRNVLPRACSFNKVGGSFNLSGTTRVGTLFISLAESRSREEEK